MLVSILVVEFEKGPCPDEIQRMSNGAGHHIGHKRTDRADASNGLESVNRARAAHLVLVELNHIRPEERVNWVEAAGEGHVSDEAYLQSGEEPAHTLDLFNLLCRIPDSAVFVEADHLESCLDDCDRIAHCGLDRLCARTGNGLVVALMQRTNLA